MFSKKKKKPLISPPSNFEHRVHTGFDKREGKFVGLPLQWASIVGNNQILKSTNRPLPLVDPSEITPTEILDLKTIVRGDHKPSDNVPVVPGPRAGPVLAQLAAQNGLVLPKTNVVRSNSLRSSSPPRLRRDYRSQANVPPSVPEEPPPVPVPPQQYSSLRRDQKGYNVNVGSIPESPVDWNQQMQADVNSVQSVEMNDNSHTIITYQNMQNVNAAYQQMNQQAHHQSMPASAQSMNGNNGNTLPATSVDNQMSMYGRHSHAPQPAPPTSSPQLPLSVPKHELRLTDRKSVV